MANIKCTNLTIVAIPEDPSKMLARWKCGQEHKDHFELVWHYSPNFGKFWVEGGRATINLPNMLNGYYNYTINLPGADVCDSVRFNVKPVSSKKTETYYEGKTKKTRTVDWWTGELVTSNWVISTLWNFKSDEWFAQRNLADKTYKEAQLLSTKADNARAAKKWVEAVKQDQATQKKAAECSEACKKLLEMRHDWINQAGWQDSEYKKIQSSMEALETRYADWENKDSDNLSAAEKKTKADSEVANAKLCLNNANLYATKATTVRKQGSLATAAAWEDMARAEFESAAWWYGKASSNATSEKEEKQYKDAQDSANSKASEAGSRADADRSKQSDIAQRPDPPTAKAELVGSSVLLDISCAAKWSDRIYIYRDENGKGEWPLWKTLTRTVPTNGAPWNTQRIYDTSVAAGSSYRYFLRCANSDTIVSDRTDMYGAFAMKPSQPRNLVAKLAGQDSVTLEWENTGSTGDSFEVQYSSWYNGNNAWIKNAVNEITTINIAGSATTATVSGLETGKKWYFRVKRVSSGGYAWATIVGGEKDNYVTTTCNVPEPPVAKLVKPTGLKAVKVDDTSVRLTWTDALEDDAHYEIEHSTNGSAWTNNAVGDITTEQYSNPGGQYQSKSFAYTVVNLERGKKHFFRVVKRTDTQQAIASPATHESKVSDWMVCCFLPAPVVSIAVPSSPKATKSSDTSIKLTWSDTQAVDDAYEIWYTDSSTAFADNAMGDIQTTTYSEYSTSKSKIFTITQLERGRTWYIKVRKSTKEGVGAWSSTVSCKLPTETLGKPTGLKAESGGTGAVKLTWTDALEEDAEYKVLLTSNRKAFSLNALDDIEEKTVSNAAKSTTAKTYTYTATGLEPGLTYYFRLQKTKEKLTTTASAASGTSKFDGSTAFFAIPVEPSPDIDEPTSLKAEKRSDDSVRLTWKDKGKIVAQSYDIQYTNDADAFADNAMGSITSVSLEYYGEQDITYGITGLERGFTWFSRVRKVCEEGRSDWVEAKGIWLEPEKEPTEELYAPTAANTLLAYPLDGTLIPLSWTHNSSENSDQSAYQIEINVRKSSGAYIPRTVNGQTAISYGISPHDWGLDDGSSVEWRVRTCGAVEDAWSPWSRKQVFKLYANPVAGVSLTSGDSSPVDSGNPLSVFPLNVSVHATSGNGDPLDTGNLPIEYAIEIIAVNGYDATADDGVPVYIASGQVLFSDSIDSRSVGFSPTGWVRQIQASEIELVGGQLYAARAWVATSQGMRSQSSDVLFSAQWDGAMPQPIASFVFDADDYTCRITPVVNMPLEDDEDGDTANQNAPTIIPLTEDERNALDSFRVNTSLPQMRGDIDFVFVDDPEVDAEGARLRQNTYIDIYRVEPNGSTVVIAQGMPNDGQARAIDAHPNFGTCTYRIVAHDQNTELSSSCDFTVETKVPYLVIQWDETWDEYDEYGLPSYGGSRLELLYNQEHSEEYAVDSVLREYVGRKYPVSYYGTQQGQSATFSADLVSTMDSEQMRLLRRLAAFPGDVYVREPHGTGYWANVSVSVSHTYDSQSVPVKLEVRRVEHDTLG